MVNAQTKDSLRRVYEHVPEPKHVITVGACACAGGVFNNFQSNVRSSNWQPAYCGECVDNCAFKALEMTKQFELATPYKEDLFMKKAVPA